MYTSYFILFARFKIQQRIIITIKYFMFFYLAYFAPKGNMIVKKVD